nr:hypothetical protein [Tanacetum cinerariifolium]
MSTSTHPIIILFDSDVEDAFSSTTTPNYISVSPNYFPASPGNISFDSSEDLSKDHSASLAILPFHDDPYMKVMQSYNDTSNESPILLPRALIAPPTVLPPFLVLLRRNRRRSKQSFILEESSIDTMADQHTMAKLLRAPTEGRSKQPFILEESPIDTMADQRTMAELLRAPTEGYAEAIVAPLILADQFELKHNLINMMTTNQFFGLEKDNPHDHIRWHGIDTKISFMLALIMVLLNCTNNTFYNALNLADQDSLNAAVGGNLLERHTKISFMLALIMVLLNFTNNTFYNALNLADQDSLNAAVGGNLLERRTEDVLTIIENKSKVRNSRNKSVVSQVKSCDANSKSSSEIAKLTNAVNQQTKIAKLTNAVNQQTSAVTTAMTAILKQFQATPPLTSVKAVEETCVTCGGAHPYYQCLAAGGNTFPELRDNIQGYVSAVAVNYNQVNFVYRPPEVKSDTENVYNDPFDSKGEKIKESKLLINELDLPCDFLPHSEYDSFIYQDFSRVDALPSTNNEDKVFNPELLLLPPKQTPPEADKNSCTRLLMDLLAH